MRKVRLNRGIVLALACCASYAVTVTFAVSWLTGVFLEQLTPRGIPTRTIADVMSPRIVLSPPYQSLFIRQDRPFTGLFLSVALLSVIIPFFMSPSLAPRVARWIGQRRMVALGCLVVALAFGSLVVYQNLPLSMDEFAPEFQAGVFAAGEMTSQWPVRLMPYAPYRGSFFAYSNASGAGASLYWPVFALLKTPFAGAQASWLLNPLLAIVFVVAMIAVIRDCRNRGLTSTEPAECDGWVILATFCTGSFVLHAISHYAYTAVVAANATVLALVLRGSRRSLFTAGCVGGLALGLVNPVPHLLFALPLVAWSVIRDQWRSFPLIKGYLLTGVPAVFFWPPLAYLVSRDLPFTASSWTDTLLAGDWLGELMNRGWAGSPGIALKVSTFLKHELWTFPGFTLIAIAGLWIRRSSPLARVCLTQIVLVTAFFLLTFRANQGFGWGSRYLMTLWPALVTGIILSIDAVREKRLNITSGVFVAMVLSLMILVPFRLYQARILTDGFIAEDPCRAMRPGEVCIVLPAAQHTIDHARMDPFLRDGKIRVYKPRSVNEAEIARRLILNPFKRITSPNGSIWARGVTP